MIIDKCIQKDCGEDHQPTISDGPKNIAVGDVNSIGRKLG